MGFGGILIECLLIELYGLVPVFCHLAVLDAALILPGALSGTKPFFLKANRLIEILHKNAGKKNVPFKN